MNNFKKIRVFDDVENKMRTAIVNGEWFDCCNSVSIMDFTGFTDSNGKDVYEGDVIQTDSYQSGPVRYDLEAGAYVVDFNDATTYIGDVAKTRFHVVGNIYIES